MRMHSDTLTAFDVYRATHWGLPGVYAIVASHGSRSRRGAVEIKLEGNGYRVNSGSHGAGDLIGATWDEWGVVIARLFDADPHAFFGSAKHPTYRNAEHFHELTGDRFRSLELPADTHKRHTWEYVSPRNFACKKCSATVTYDY